MSEAIKIKTFIEYQRAWRFCKNLFGSAHPEVRDSKWIGFFDGKYYHLKFKNGKDTTFFVLKWRAHCEKMGFYNEYNN